MSTFQVNYIPGTHDDDGTNIHTKQASMECLLALMPKEKKYVHSVFNTDNLEILSIVMTPKFIFCTYVSVLFNRRVSFFVMIK